MREKVQWKQTVIDFNKRVRHRKTTNMNIHKSTFVCPIYTFSLAGNKFVYTPTQGKNGEKYFNHIIYKGKMPNLAGKNTSPSFFSITDYVFSISRQKKTRVQSVRNGNQSGYSRA